MTSEPRLFIHLRPESLAWAYFHGTDKLAFGSADTLEAELKRIRTVDFRVIAVAPAEDVLLCHAALSRRQMRHRNDILAYAVEGQLAGDISDMHVALGPMIEEGAYAVAVVNKACMERWLDRLMPYHLIPDEVISETFLLPFEAGKWSLLRTPHYSLLRTRSYGGMGMETASIDTALESAATEGVASISAWSEQGDVKFPELTISVENHAIETDPFAWLCTQYGITATMLPINLLQGAYRKRQRQRVLPREWKKIAALLLLWFGLQLMLNVGKAWYLDNKAAQFDREASALYHQHFPNDSDVGGDIRARLSDRLAEGNGFIGLLSRTVHVLAAPKIMTGIELQGMGYNKTDNTLALDVTMRTPGVLEALKPLLVEKQLNLAVASADASSPRTRLLIKDKP